MEIEYKDKDIAAARIQSCSDWEPLFDVLRDMKDIPGTPNKEGISKVYPAEELIEKINLARKNPQAKILLQGFTKNLGIRDKIEQLMAADVSKANPTESSWDEQELDK